MKVLIQLGENKWEFDDGIGSSTLLETAVDAISNLLKAVYSIEMKDQRLVILDEDFADQLFRSAIEDNDKLKPETGLGDQNKN